MNTCLLNTFEINMYTNISKNRKKSTTVMPSWGSCVLFTRLVSSLHNYTLRYFPLTILSLASKSLVISFIKVVSY